MILSEKLALCQDGLPPWRRLRGATLLGAEKGGKQHSPFVPMQAE